MDEFLLARTGVAQPLWEKKFKIFSVVHRRTAVIPKIDPVVHVSTHKLIFNLWTTKPSQERSAS